MSLMQIIYLKKIGGTIVVGLKEEKYFKINAMRLLARCTVRPFVHTTGDRITYIPTMKGLFLVASGNVRLPYT